MATRQIRHVAIEGGEHPHVLLSRSKRDKSELRFEAQIHLPQDD